MALSDPPTAPPPVATSPSTPSSVPNPTSQALSVEEAKRRFRDAVPAGSLRYKAIQGKSVEAEESRRLAKRSKIRLSGLIILVIGIIVLVVASVVVYIVPWYPHRYYLWPISGLACIACIVGSIMMCVVGCCCGK